MQRPRRAWLGAALLLLLLVLLSPARFRVALQALERATAASRSEEAHRWEIVQAAFRYGIPLDLAAAIDRAAREADVEPELAFRLVRVESDFKERAVSPVGALGLTQLMPATAAGMQPGITRDEIFERDTNLRLGFRYLRWLLRVYDGDVSEALHAYNRGIGTVTRIRAAGGNPANGYADKVLGVEGARPVGLPRALGPRPALPVRPLHELPPARLR
ncbi:MAG: lytic transglycosylase domain-containing protein [Gemmatimonadota bacterium]|jgi:soluble lytic murein transglycosylase-like protein|nr:lytic transglycosylase domain-containing protein [Gemmatimonadota bacterium]